MPSQETIIGVVRELANRVSSSMQGSNSSLVEFTQATRVEPIVVIDSSVVLNDAMPEIMQSLLAQFAAFYLQAVSLITNVDKVSALRKLDTLNPNRDGLQLEILRSKISMEDYQFKLPKYNRPQASMEAVQDMEFRQEIPVIDKELVFRPLAPNPGDHTDVRDKDKLRDSITQLKDLENLSVGKLLAVSVCVPGPATTTKDKKGNTTVKESERSVEIPVQLRLLATSINTQQMVNVLGGFKADKTWKERYHGWKSGRLEFWKDLILCRDLIDAHRRHLMKDTDGVLNEINTRQRNNSMASFISNNPSVATASNMAVISEMTQAMVENEIGGKLDDFKTRQKIFEETSLMILVVIDQQWNRIKFYYRGISQSTELSPRDLKASNKGNGPDILDLLKLFQVGKPAML